MSASSTEGVAGDERRAIDLNFDGGEGFDDQAVAPWVTTIHVACGGHAGDADSMRRALDLAARHALSVGAHPSYPDRAGFGRTAMAMPAAEAARLACEQVGALVHLAEEAGIRVAQVKPHGALYHAAATDDALAEALARELHALDPRFIVLGPRGSALHAAGRALGLRPAVEGFVDRRYRADGSLTPRTEPDALLRDSAEAARQAVSIARRGRAVSREGVEIDVPADTLCLHGDTEGAARIAEAVARALAAEGVRTRRIDQANQVQVD